MTSKQMVKMLFPDARVVDRDPIGFSDKVVMVGDVTLVQAGDPPVANQGAAWRAARRAIVREAESRGVAVPIPRWS